MGAYRSTCEICHVEIPKTIIINGEHKTVRRKRCFQCSPRGNVYNVSAEYFKLIKDNKKQCTHCQRILALDQFYKRSSRTSGLHSLCKECDDVRSKERINKTKKQCIEYKGGCCIKCGYNKCIFALDFHHKDPTQKKFNISKYRKNSFQSLKSELDKCDLLCSNCHRELWSIL